MSSNSVIALIAFVVAVASAEDTVASGEETCMIQKRIGQAGLAAFGEKSKTFVNGHAYTVCNGLSNQLLAHSASIAYAIKHNVPVLIPDAFILNGVQTQSKSHDHRLKDVTPSNSRFTKLASVFDVEFLISVIETFGISAKLIPYDDKTHANLVCSWERTLATADADVVVQILRAFKPASVIKEIVDLVDEGLKDTRAVCVHHRDGEDWKNHCKQWENIPDSIWRHNCMNDPTRSLSSDIRARLLPDSDSVQNYPTVFYVGDHSPPQDLRKSGMPVTTRAHILAKASAMYGSAGSVSMNNESAMENEDGSIALDSGFLHQILSDKYHPCPSDYRDVCAVVDFLSCSSIPEFVGNSVSTWSALQIAQRDGKATWYNSRSIPLATMVEAYPMPIVYTYNEGSEATGKDMLMVSILSARHHVPASQIYVLYLGNEDREFRMWLLQHNVEILNHNPTWIPEITEMFKHGDVKKSTLFHHLGNYIGTWQRIDIPLYINAEYVLLLDADTVVTSQFSYKDFGNEMTQSIAFSAEALENGTEPWNAGVALLGLPYLRETHSDFLKFITSHKNSPLFRVTNSYGTVDMPSDQGAYLAYYSQSKKFLSKIFNEKPYYTQRREAPKIIHFHGAKPHDYLGHWLGVPCLPALIPICDHMLNFPFLCKSLKDFTQSALLDEGGDKLLIQYCSRAFATRDDMYAQQCVKFFKFLSETNEKDALPHDNIVHWDELTDSESGKTYYYKRRKTTDICHQTLSAVADFVILNGTN